MSERQTATKGQPITPPTRLMSDVLHDVVLERRRQSERWGDNAETEFGTGRNERALRGLGPWSNQSAEHLARLDYDERAAAGHAPTWVDLLREEFLEVACESDVDRLYTEVIQLAALCVSMAEQIETRRESEW